MQSSEELARAEQLLREGKRNESLAAFKRLLADPDSAADGHYGIGYINWKSGDSEAAATAFRSSLKLNPDHADAAYWLGIIAKGEGQPGVAEAYFLLALKANPKHAGALENLPNSTSTRREAENKINNTALPPDGPPPVPDNRANEAHRFYRLLRGDGSALGLHVADLIDSLQISVQPRLSAYIAGILALVLMPILTFVSVASSGMPEHVGWPIILNVLALSVIFLVYLILFVKSKRISFEGGRILIISGVILKRRRNIELYRVTDMEIKQTFWNRITGDGSLILSIERGGKSTQRVSLRGLVKYGELEEILLKLRNLVLLLRSGNWGKGIIY
ncbi:MULTISPECIES: PH domain-containing protein [unclassified Burkholderia]|uniref:PH domain-containing protein n=1 Tax=unclassified Burkholderia TaxID=2613784 RepID=UPI000F55D27B|nr:MULTISPECIES: PH domain-containing protein [unclassified Burkholderia]RQR84844.1 hypothetical protein DIE10_10590 [Burkholderia sp. Bp9011]RQR94797.1 hypothetical protein DIE09_10775 [Burkholderia sp. Bp9010]RQS77102.1 hypothetical protein DID97_13440 [Burkholderia sp. Bp8977]